jgi:DNA repair protein RadC
MESKAPHYLNHRKRLKERFLKAPEAVPDAEIIELLLGYVIRGKDVKPQSKELLNLTKKISDIFDGNLKNVKGLGDETVCFFKVLQEFISRYGYQKIETTPLDLGNTGQVYQFLKPKISHATKEVFVLLFLNAKNHMIDYQKVREGFINSVGIAAREIIELAIDKNAVGVIICHNHPSGDTTPSESDLVHTREVCNALIYTGVTLIDHIIVASSEYYSMSAHGHIKEFYDEAKKR